MRLAKWVSGIFVLATAAIAVIVVMARVLHPEAVCLLADTRDGQGGNVTAIDPTSGNRYIYRRAPAFLPQESGHGDLSPDSSHEIYLVGPPNGPYSLYVDPKPLKQQNGYLYCFDKSVSCWIGEHTPNPGARLVASGIQEQFVAAWLDNDRIAYSIPVEDHKQTLVVERIDGSSRYRLPMTFDKTDEIAIRSSDAQRIVFTVSKSNTSDLYVWSLPDGRVIAYSGLNNYPYGGPTLSPLGKYVTMIDQSHMIILATETQQRFDFALQSKGFGITDWAPDERHLVAQYQDDKYWEQQLIFGIDGTQISLPDAYGKWSKDGRFYFYLSNPGKLRNLVVMHVDDGQLETLASSIDQLYGVLDNGQILATWYEGSKLTLGILDPETRARHIISDDISDIRDIRILNNGHTILYIVAHGDQGYSAEVINADGSNYVLLGRGIPFLSNPRIINEGKSFLFIASHEKLFSLEMVDLDGSNHRIFATGLEDIPPDYTWSIDPNGSAVGDSETPDFLAFAGKRNGVLIAELVNLHTGDHRVLGHGYANIHGVGPDPRVGGISFYWEDANHEYGIDVFTIDGKPIFHMKLPGDYSYSSAYKFFRYLPSPNKNVVAVREVNDFIKLYFIASDSSWQKQIEADLGGEGGGSSSAQAWSPDGKQFAFYANDPAGNSIRILDEKGDELHRFTGFTASSSSSLLWTHCQ